MEGTLLRVAPATVRWSHPMLLHNILTPTHACTYIATRAEHGVWEAAGSQHAPRQKSRRLGLKMGPKTEASFLLIVSVLAHNRHFLLASQEQSSG